MSTTHRPLPKGYENVRYENAFELRYLRWDYLVRVPNPKPGVMEKFEKITSIMASNAFRKYRAEFLFQGMALEDVTNIARCFTVAFLGLYSFEAKPEKLDRFREQLRKQGQDGSDEAAIHKKQVYNLMAFLEQRLQECAFIFRQKSKESAGFSIPRTFVQVRPGFWPTDSELMKDPTRYGWQVLSYLQYSAIRSKLASISIGESIEVDGKLYRIVSDKNMLLYNEMVDRDEIYAQPEFSGPTALDILLEVEEKGIKKTSVRTNSGRITLALSKEDRLDRLASKYKKASLEQKLRMLKRLERFLSKKRRLYREKGEVRRMIRTLSAKGVGDGKKTDQILDK